MDGDFELMRLDLEPAMRALHVDIPSEGVLEAKGRYAMRAGALDTLSTHPRWTPRSRCAKAACRDWISCVPCRRRRARPPGGKTKFDEMTGNFNLAGKRYQYSSVRLQAGLLTATGQLEAVPSEDVNGRAYVELRSSASTVKGSFRITGSVKGMTLKP